MSGACLYAPVLLWLNGWFLTKRGLASGIVFSGQSRSELSRYCELTSAVDGDTTGTGMGGFAFPFLIGKVLDDHGEQVSRNPEWKRPDSFILSPAGFATMCRMWAGVTAFVFLLAIRFTSPRIPLRKPIGPRPKWFAIDFKTINHPIVWTMVS